VILTLSRCVRKYCEWKLLYSSNRTEAKVELGRICL